MQNTFSSVAVFIYPTGATSAINLALLDRDTINPNVSQVCKSLISTKQVWHLNNNFSMYCGNVNYYTGNCPKIN